MLRFTKVIDGDEYINRKLEDSTVSILEAIHAYKEGKKIAVNMGDRFYILEIDTIFTTDFEFLVNARYVIIP